MRAPSSESLLAHGCSIPIEQPRISDDVMKKIFIVNHTIAAKFGGQEEEAKELLASLDWTAYDNAHAYLRK
jgi:hypothetical protein